MARHRHASGKYAPPTLQERAAATLKEVAKLTGFYPVQFSPGSKPCLAFGHRAWQWDDETKTTFSRKRGERGKLAGAILIEDIAVEELRERKAFYKPHYDRAGSARSQALVEVASMFGIISDTLEDWDRGVRRKERRKPIEERSFRRRKQKKQSGD